MEWWGYLVGLVAAFLLVAMGYWRGYARGFADGTQVEKDRQRLWRGRLGRRRQAP